MCAKPDFRFTVPTEGQLAVSVKPPVGVMWLTHSEVMPPAEQCSRVAALQQQFNFLYAGTDFFDGSHVVCNATR